VLAQVEFTPFVHAVGRADRRSAPVAGLVHLPPSVGSGKAGSRVAAIGLSYAAMTWIALAGSNHSGLPEHLGKRIAPDPGIAHPGQRPSVPDAGATFRVPVSR